MKRSHIVSNCLQAALGLMLILWPQATLRIGVRVISVVLMLIAANGIYAYVEDRHRDVRDLLGLLGSVALLIAGFYGAFFTLRVEHRLSVLIGLVILGMGAYRFYRAARGSGDRTAMTLSAITMVFGLIVLLNPFRSLRIFAIVAGIAILYNALTGWLTERSGR